MLGSRAPCLNRAQPCGQSHGARVYANVRRLDVACSAPVKEPPLPTVLARPPTPVDNVLKQVTVPDALPMLERRAIPRTSVGKLLQDIDLLNPGALFMHMHKWAGDYGKVYYLDIIVKKLLIVSDANIAKHILYTNAANHNKGMLTELLDFIMGSGLITANGETAVTRRREIAPGFHMKYVQNMLHLFGRSVHRASSVLDEHCISGQSANIEKMFGQMSLDILGVAVFEHDFHAFTMEDQFMQAVGKLLRESELRSVSPFPFWNYDWLCNLIPQQREVKQHLKVVNETLDVLIAKCEAKVAEQNNGDEDPGTSILGFLLRSGSRVTKKQLRDDLMTLLIADTSRRLLC
eukprot:jgi/Botrbrau1/16778/Bobra.150_2s0013.1